MPFWSFSPVPAGGVRCLAAPPSYRFPWWKLVAGGGSSRSSTNKLTDKSDRRPDLQDPEVYLVSVLHVRSHLPLCFGSHQGHGQRKERRCSSAVGRLELSKLSSMLDDGRWRLLIPMSTGCDDGNWNSPASSHEQGMPTSPTSPTPKRPAGRTKFKETRHPVFHGVRRRGSNANGRWLCEVRVPGKQGERLWLGTHVTAEAAARAHDAAMLALYGHSPAARLNFPDSAWLLAVPACLSDLADVRHAAIGAVGDFLRRQATSAGAATAEVTPVDGVTTAASASSQLPYTSSELEVPDALCHDILELHTSGEMDAGTYYADLAQGLLLESPPPPASVASLEHGDQCSQGGDDAALWSH